MLAFSNESQMIRAIVRKFDFRFSVGALFINQIIYRFNRGINEPRNRFRDRFAMFRQRERSVTQRSKDSAYRTRDLGGRKTPIDATSSGVRGRGRVGAV